LTGLPYINNENITLARHPSFYAALQHFLARLMKEGPRSNRFYKNDEYESLWPSQCLYECDLHVTYTY